jgi:hypothetical protein
MQSKRMTSITVVKPVLTVMQTTKAAKCQTAIAVNKLGASNKNRDLRN